MDNFLGNFSDELAELGKDTAQGIIKTAKQQIVGVDNRGDKGDKGSKKIDPVTGKPIPGKKVLSDLIKATAQLAQMRLKKVREELERQRLKISEPPFAKASEGQAGPEIKPAVKPKDDAVAQTLKNSKSTGEFGRQVGG